MTRASLRRMLGYAYYLIQPNGYLTQVKAARKLKRDYLLTFRIRKETKLTHSDMREACQYAQKLRFLCTSKPRAIYGLRDLPIDQLAIQLSDLLSH